MKRFLTCLCPVYLLYLSWWDFCAFVVSLIYSDRSLCYGKILFGFFDPGNKANEVYLINLLILLAKSQSKFSNANQAVCYNIPIKLLV